MRVLHIVATGERRGAEMFASELVSALNDRGVDQRVAVLRWSGETQVRFDAPTSVWDSGRRRAPGLRVSFRTMAELRRLSRAWNPHLVQTYGSEALKYAITSGLGRKRPVVYRKIGALAPWARQGSRRRGHAALARRAARIVAVAEAVRREAVDVLGVPASKIVTIPRGVDPRRLEATIGRTDMRANLGIDARARVVLFLGALTWEKDPLSAVESFGAIAGQTRESVLVIAGDGPLRADVARAAADGGLTDRLLMLGNRPDVGNLLKASDVLLLSSRAEGMPGCVIEAGMAGLPVVAYSVGGVGEVVEDQTTGLLSALGNIEKLSSDLACLLDRPEVGTRLGEAGRTRCLDHFDTRRIASRYLDLYEELART